jgi:hypothetical protein
MKEILSLFTNLQTLEVDLRRRGTKYKLVSEVLMANVKEWKVACPQLTSVIYDDGW